MTTAPVAPSQRRPGRAWQRGDAVFRVGLCVPMRGSAGIWGPSCLAAAQLAEAELNSGWGIQRRPCDLVVVDASAESAELEATLTDLVDSAEIHALVGMCISSVRRRIVAAVGGRLPFVYPCLYEGGESTPGAFAIGETSSRQLQPSIAWLHARGQARRWMLVGHDYIWPRVSHAIARCCIAQAGGEVVAEAVVPFGSNDYGEVFDQLRKNHADALLISMVGQDAVDFNRAFSAAGLSRHVLRLSCAIEENQLLAIGAQHTENLHVSLAYFDALQTDANLAFKERYRARYGERAPPLNSIGQSLYEGMHFLATAVEHSAQTRSHSGHPGAPVAYASARNASYMGAAGAHSPMYLARAEGHSFRVLARF